MKSVVIVLLFMAGFCLPQRSFGQCPNAIQLKKASIDNVLQTGEIEITISTSKSFTCTLNVEKGTGQEKLDSKKGSGSQTLVFKNLPRNNAYQVVVEFVGEENRKCKTLQKSQIIIE